MLAILLVGCADRSAPALPTGPLLTSQKDLRPDVAPGRRAKLSMGGVAVPVDVAIERSGGDFTLTLNAHGSAVDLEKYRSTDEGFFVQFAEGEAYQPAIPLVRYPMRVGESWNWSGSMTAARQTRSAKASVTSAVAKLSLDEGPVSAIRIDVRLILPATEKEPSAQRTLAFWFVPSRGLLRREFGTESIREPVEELP